jgi:N-acetylmuramoyl-L-alanine amidase
MKTIAVQCGHGVSLDGSWDPGCVYRAGGKQYTEAALMLKITKSAVKYLRKSGVTVISDSDHGNNKNMIEDVRWANRVGAALYVSIHCDYSGAPKGVMPLYVSGSGKKLAKCLKATIKKDMGMKSRGVQKRTNLWELNVTDMPACILETGSIKADLATFRDHPDKYGKAIAKGICKYMGVKFSDGTKKPAASGAEIYRVRKAWNKPGTQKGAFRNLASAKKCADKNGYSVFNEKGKAVYHGKK